MRKEDINGKFCLRMIQLYVDNDSNFMNKEEEVMRMDMTVRLHRFT